MPRVDAHHHLWDPGRHDYPFLSRAGLEPLRRPFGVSDLHAVAEAAGITATVVVQATHDVAETLDLLATAASDPLIAGVVGWVDLTGSEVAEQVTGRIAELRAAPGGDKLVGIRHQAEDEPDPGWLNRDDVRDGIAAVGAAGLVYDLLVTPAQLEAAVDVARSLPDVGFVLDHLGKPDVAIHGWQPWAGYITELAGCPNVTAKLSGLVTEADWRGWSDQDLAPYIRHAVAEFGASRVMFGSDWPVCTLAACYERVLEAAATACPNLTDDQRAAVFADTATRVYGLAVAANK